VGGRRSSAATREKPAPPGITSCAQGASLAEEARLALPLPEAGGLTTEAIARAADFTNATPPH
jgi:hypothetical protein